MELFTDVGGIWPDFADTILDDGSPESIRDGSDLDGLGERTIRLRANLSSNELQATPMLHDWSVTYTDASGESAWSDVESSLP